MTATVAASRAVVDDDRTLLALLDDLARYGVARITGLEPTMDGATAVAERIGRIRTTVFGGLWRLSSAEVEHHDTAYSSAFLEPHTDGTYLHDAPRAQLFCCVERGGTGGESILVDGLAAAEALQSSDPAAFSTLCSVAVPGRYLEPGVDLRAERPTIRCDQDGFVAQVSFNNYDRAPFWRPEPEMSRFYAAYGAFHDVLVDTSRWCEIRLEPGDALLFDNWRVLHGRRAYSGERTFYGCYFDHDEIAGRRRVLTERLP